MEPRRSKLEIYLEVLGTIKSGTSKPTHIMYQTNVSWQPLKRMIGYMVDQGVVREIDTSAIEGRDKRTSKIYEITTKGEQVLNYFRGAKEFHLEAINIPY